MKKYLAVFIFSILLVSIAFSQTGEKMSWVRVFVDTPLSASNLRSLNVDVCSGGSDYMDILTTQSTLARIDDMGYHYTILDEDIHDWSEEIKAGKGYSGYHNYTELVNDLNDLADNYPDIFKLVELGEGWREEGKIWACKISDNVNTEENEPEMFIHGTTHAREPMTCEVCVYYLQEMCENYGINSVITEIIDELQIWVVPVMNVDGWVHDDVENLRDWWRKNGYDTDGDDVYYEWYYGYYTEGVDLNRNYTYMWGYDDEGSSDWEYDWIYRGPSAGSEPETQLIMDLCEDHDFEVAISFHTYGEYILIPWGYQYQWPPEPDRTVFEEIGDGMNDIIHDHIGRYYDFGPGSFTIYKTNGDFTDYFYGEHEQFGFTLELNNDAQGGFYPDDSYIQPTCEMIFDVLTWVNEWVMDNYTDIELITFNAEAQKNGVLLNWSIEDADGLLGFNIYRTTQSENPFTRDVNNMDSTYKKINTSLITGDNPFQYLDSDVENGRKYLYKLEAVEENNSSSFGPYGIELSTPTPFEICKIYPNPATSEINVNFTISENTEVEVAIYDISGRKIKEYDDVILMAGEHIKTYDVSDLSNGMYLYQIAGDDSKAMKKFLVIE